jgi:hypothetical protein
MLRLRSWDRIYLGQVGNFFYENKAFEELHNMKHKGQPKYRKKRKKNDF